MSIYCDFNQINVLENDSNLNRKKNALKVVTNTVQSPKKLSSKKSNMGLKTKKILPMEKFETETKCVSPSLNINYELIEEPGHIHCRALQEKGNFIIFNIAFHKLNEFTRFLL